VIWKAIALIGSGSFFVVGWGVLTDPQCNSVSFRGGGARTVVTTCYADSRGDFSKMSAVTGSWLIGLVILGFLFWPTLKILFNNYQFNQKLGQGTKEYALQEDEIEGIEQTLDQPSNLTSNQFTNLKKKISENKFIAAILVAVLVFGFYKVAAPKITLLNPITCSSLKKELGAKDVQGRQLWGEYQSEVSRLGLIDSGISYEIWRNQVGNVQRRAVQLISNDLAKYDIGFTKPHCVKIAVLNYLNTISKKNLSVLAGQTPLDNGIYWNFDYGWATGIYSKYFESELFLK
jgi:hypothetical protein